MKVKSLDVSSFDEFQGVLHIVQKSCNNPKMKLPEFFFGWVKRTKQALYPSIPIPKALDCVRRKLLNDTTLVDRTDWKPDDIMKLLEICLETHFKTIDGKIYTQLDGTKSI